MGSMTDEMFTSLVQFPAFNQASSGYATDLSGGTDVFQEMLDLMLTEIRGGFNAALISGEMPGTDLFGTDQMTAMLMDLLAPLLQNSNGANADMSGSLMQQAYAIQINQFEAEIMVGGDGANANCGPASLTMALRSLGLQVSGCGWASNPGEMVDQARESMTSDWQDGIDGNGNRSEGEHNTFTNLSDIQRGAQAAGASTRRLDADPAAIRLALLSGDCVVVSGTFAGKNPLPWTGDRGSDNRTAPGGATGHFVLVSGFDPSLNTFVINDPARNSPLMVDAGTLTAFMQGNAGALAIGR